MRTSGENSPQHIAEVATKLNAIGNWMSDQHRIESDTSRLLNEAARLLSRMAINTCGSGYVGCPGGPKCNSDHK